MMRSRKQQKSANGHCSLPVTSRAPRRPASGLGRPAAGPAARMHPCRNGRSVWRRTRPARFLRFARWEIEATRFVGQPVGACQGALPDGDATADRFQLANWPMPYLLVLRGGVAPARRGGARDPRVARPRSAHVVNVQTAARTTARWLVGMAGHSRAAAARAAAGAFPRRRARPNGLAIARGLVEACGDTITVANLPVHRRTAGTTWPTAQARRRTDAITDAGEIPTLLFGRRHPRRRGCELPGPAGGIPTCRRSGTRMLRYGAGARNAQLPAVAIAASWALRPAAYPPPILIPCDAPPAVVVST
jgi:hypothetical protein